MIVRQGQILFLAALCTAACLGAADNGPVAVAQPTAVTQPPQHRRRQRRLVQPFLNAHLTLTPTPAP
jgi:hypothetical protein